MELQDSLSAEVRFVRLQQRLPETYRRLWQTVQQVRTLQTDISLITPAATVDELSVRRELVGFLHEARDIHTSVVRQLLADQTQANDLQDYLELRRTAPASGVQDG
jgi:hypothetical protein